MQSLTIAYCDFKDFEHLNGLQVETIFLWNNKLTGFPAGLDLPQLDSLYLSHNRIKDLHVDGNQINDLSPLAACAGLAKLWEDDNPLATLAPLSGRRFQRLAPTTHCTPRRWRCNWSCT